MKTKESCGCAHDGARWLVMCAQHEGETLVLHAMAAGDYGQHMKKLGWGPLVPEPTRGHADGGPANFQNLPRHGGEQLRSMTPGHDGQPIAGVESDEFGNRKYLK